MPTTGTLSISGSGDSAVFFHEHTTSASGDYKVLFETKNTFVDKDIAVTITTPAAGAATLDITDLTSSLSMGTASNGEYSPTVNLSGTVTPATAGWLTASASNVADNNVKIGKVNQSILKNGNISISSGDAIIPDTTSAQTINITEGYESARTVVVGAMSSGTKAVVTSGSATIDTLSYAYSSANDNFSVTGNGTISAPTVSTAGYISSSDGTKNTNTASVSTSITKIIVGSEIDGSYTKVTPVITRTAKTSGATWVDAASGDAVTSTTSNKPYVQVDAAAVSSTITTKGKVTTAGYGTTTNYGVATSLSSDVGTNAAITKYIPITEASTFSASIGSITASNLAIGEKNNGTYPITSTLSIPATLTANTDGWFHSGTAIGSKSSVLIGSIAEATFSIEGDSVVAATDGYIESGTSIVSINAASFANTGTSGISYTDISSSAPILISGDYLYINAGYVGNSKISLARLVPDDLSSNTLSFAPAQYILSGYAAFDNAGVEITGTMATYNGAYTVT